MKIIVTGCLGFIGSHLTEKLLKEGNFVYGIDSCTYAANLEKIEEFQKKFSFFHFVKDDISKIEFLPDADFVVNTAAESHVGNSILDSRTFLESNVIGVQNLLNLIKEKKEKPVLIHFSTDEVYGDIFSGKFTEKFLLNPSNPYSASKAAADMLINAWGRTHDVPFMIVRPSNNYGKLQHREKLIPLVVELLKKEKPIPLHDEGKPIRTWLHVEDTCDAVLTLMRIGKVGEIYNISGNVIQSNLTTVEKIIKEFDKFQESKSTLDLTAKRKGQDVRYAVDDKKLQSLGWRAHRHFDEEIGEIVKHFFFREPVWK